MALFKNVTGQKIAVYAHDTAADAPKTGDAANITAQISLDYGTAAATNDTNPTELDATDHPGIYVFTLTQAETNAEAIVISAVSATSNISIEPVQVFTTPVYNDPTAAAIRTEIDSNSTQLAAIAADANSAYMGTDDIQNRIPASLVNGRMDSTIDGTGMEAGAVNAVQSGLATSTALTALAAKFTGITLLIDVLGAMVGKTTDAAALGELNASPAGTNYDNTTDSPEAIADAAGGGSTVNVTTSGTNISSD